MRGTIFGAMGARLGTGIHGGPVRADACGAAGAPAPQRRDRRDLDVPVVLLPGRDGQGRRAAFGESTISLWDLVTISVVGGAIASVAILFVTVGLALLSYRKGWDLDAVSTPMVTAIGDMVTLPALFLATFIPRHDAVNAVVAAGCTARRGRCRGVPSWSRREVRRTLVEMTAVIAVCPAPRHLRRRAVEARRPSLEAVPAIVILPPPFVRRRARSAGSCRRGCPPSSSSA